MRTKYIFLLLCSLLATFFLGRWSVKQPVQHFSKMAWCSTCLDSCLLRKKIIVRDGSTKSTFLDTIKNLAFEDNTIRKEQRRITKQRTMRSKPIWIYLDTIIDAAIPVYSDELSPIKRREYPSYERVKNKIRLHFYINDPQNDYALKTEVLNGQTTYRREKLLDGIIIKDIETNKVESIRILMDSMEYIF